MMRRTTALPMVVAGAVSLSLTCHVALADTAPGRNCQTPSKASHPAVTPAPWNRVNSASGVEGRLDPLIFFDELVTRYRGLTAYSDLTRIIHVTRHIDDPKPQRTETHVACELTDGKLNVITPGAQLRRGLGLALPLRQSGEMEQAQLRYDLWLLPHMALRFSDKPLEELREGVPEGFTATEAATVTIDDRPMVHLELTSGDGLSGDYNARFDVYVDAESMLIERIEGRQRLPDGGDFETTYHITPTLSQGGEPARSTATADESGSTMPTQPAIMQPCGTAPSTDGDSPTATCPRGKVSCGSPFG